MKPPFPYLRQAPVKVDPEIGAAGDIDTAIVTLSYADGEAGCDQK